MVPTSDRKNSERSANDAPIEMPWFDTHDTSGARRAKWLREQEDMKLARERDEAERGEAASHRDLVAAQFENPAVHDVMLRQDVHMPWVSNGDDAYGQTSGGSSILPFHSRPVWAASATHEVRDGDGTHSDSGIVARIPVARHVDRRGRVVTLYHSAMPDAQRDHGHKDFTAKMEACHGVHAVRQKPRGDGVPLELNGRNRENDHIIAAGVQAETLVHAGTMPTANRTHTGALEERDWKRCGMYDGLNHIQANEAYVPRIVEATTRSTVEAALPPRAAESTIGARVGSIIRSLGRKAPQSVTHRRNGFFASGARKNPLVILKDATVRAGPHAEGMRNAAPTVDGRAHRAQILVQRRDAPALDSATHAAGSSGVAGKGLTSKVSVGGSDDVAVHDVKHHTVSIGVQARRADGTARATDRIEVVSEISLKMLTI